MTFCDTHIHLLAPEWQRPVEERIADARQSRISWLLQPGVRAADWDSLIALGRKHPGVFAAPGLHPMSAAEWSDSVAVRLRGLCGLPQVLAIGEIGLDALLDVDPQLQEEAFRGQVEIAVDVGLPVLIHCRKKIDELLRILQQAEISKVGGILHGFSGSVETAQRAIDHGLMIGIGPVLLRQNVRKLPEVINAIPAEMLVLETDAPDMAAGSEVLVDVAGRLAELRGWSLKQTAEITTANARRLLKFDQELSLTLLPEGEGGQRPDEGEP